MWLESSRRNLSNDTKYVQNGLFDDLFFLYIFIIIIIFYFYIVSHFFIIRSFKILSWHLHMLINLNTN